MSDATATRLGTGDAHPVHPVDPGPGTNARRWLRPRSFVLGVLAALLLLGGGIGAVMLLAGGSFVVNSTADRVDARPGDGRCETATRNQCTVRAAIQESNALAGRDTIRIPAGTYSLAIVPTNDNMADSGDHDITETVTIEGAGPATVLDGGQPAPGSPPNERALDRVLEVHATAGDVTIDGVTVNEGFSAEEGGAIEVGTPPPAIDPNRPPPATTLRLRDSTIQNSYAVKAGGGINVVGRGRVELIDSTVTGNGSGGSGAAINNAESGVVSILAGSRIVDNPGTSYDPGASAISNEGLADAVGTIRILDSTVAGNVSTQDGAGVQNAGDGNVVVERSTISGNTAGGAGGGIYTASGTLTVTGGSITGNSAGEGAGVYAAGEVLKIGLRPRITLTGTTLADNTAVAAGGGVVVNGDGQMAVTDVTVTGNDAGGEGGGIVGTGRSTLTVTRGVVTGNTALGYGGGIAAEAGRSTLIDGVTVSGNTGGDDGGGGIHTDGPGATTVRGSTVVDNTATGDGGGLSIQSFGVVEVVDTRVTGNTVTCEECGGGGIENGGARVTLTRLLVADNTATGDGGGIHNTSSGELTIVDTKVERNTAANGGGQSNASDSTLVIRGSLFAYNTAKRGPGEDTGRGGGFHSLSDGGGVIENSTFSSNSARTSGGGMYHDADAGMELHNVTVWGNSAPAGGALSTVETDFVPSIPPIPNPGIILRNTIVGGSTNGGSCDAQVSSQGGNLDTGTECFVAAANTPGAATTGDRMKARVNLDALADNGGPTATHALRADSPAVDRAVSTVPNADGTSAAACPQTDQRGVTRPLNRGCDAGAYEYAGPPAPLDPTPPDTRYLTGPVQSSLEKSAFTFTGSDPGNVTPVEELTYECRLVEYDPTEPPELLPPGEPLPPELQFVGCTSPWEVPLISEGRYRFEVRAIDQQGNVDPTPAVHDTGDLLDITPPQTELTEVPRDASDLPPDASAGRAGTFGFVGRDIVTPPQFITFECRVDSRDPDAWFECFSPTTFADLTTGTHTVEVRALDGAENVDPSPARYTWTVGAPTNCDDANLTLRSLADASVNQTVPNEAQAFSPELTVAAGELPGNAARALVRFGLPTDASACNLQTATLRLHAGSATEGRTLEVRPLAAPFEENRVTWDTQPATTDAAPATVGSADGWIDVDVTALVRQMNAGTLSNHGFQIRDLLEVDPAGGGDQSFASRELPFEPPDPSLAPQLVLRYDADARPAPPAPIPATEAEPVYCGQVLIKSILVANDLTDCPGEGLVVGRPGIVVDLNGHTIDGPDYLLANTGQEGGYPAGIRNAGHDNVVIRNGTVQQFGHGVLLSAGTTRTVVEDVTALRNATAGIELNDADDGRNGNIVRGSRISDNELGIQIFNGSENSVVTGNEITGNLGEAVHIDASSGHKIDDNLIHGIPSDPLLDSDGGFLLTNASGNLIANNTMRDTGDAGLVLSDRSNGNRIENNTLFRNGDAGVSVQDSAGTQITGNTSHQQSDGGVVLGDAPDTVVRGNDLRFNPHGVETGGTDRLVLADNNGSDSQQDGFAVGNGASMQIVGNRADRTGGTGISVDSSAFDANGNAIDTALIENNTASDNLAGGIAVAAGGHRVAGNAAYNNARVGIAAQGNVDGGGNRAGGNGGLTQCDGVVCDESGEIPAPAGPDVNEPNTTIITGPAPVSTSTTATFTFGASDGPNGTPLTAMRFECRLDPGPDPQPEPVDPDPVDPPGPPNPNEPPEPVEPPDPVDPLPTEGWESCISPVTYADLDTGDHRFEVRALDQADLRDLTAATFDWTVEPVIEGGEGPDTLAPDTTIREFPPNPSTSDAASFRFTGSDNATPGANLRYECRLDSIDPAPFLPCTSPQDLGDLALGRHTFEVRAVDRTGNVDGSPAQYVWEYDEAPADTVAPDTTVLSGPDRAATDPVARFTFSSSEAVGTFECSLDGASFATCSSPAEFAGLASGAHRLDVRARDAAGNADPTPTTYRWSVNPPVVAAEVFCGQVLTRSTLVTNDLVDCENDGLVIGANGITVDLGGHLIDGKDQAAAIRNDGFDAVVVTGGGTLSQFDAGVELRPGSTDNVVSSLTLQGHQLAGLLATDADRALVRDNLAVGNGVGIMLFDGTEGAVVRGNTVGSTNGDGIHVETSNGNRIEENLVTGSNGGGIAVGGAGGNTVRANVLEANSGGGVLVAPNELVGFGPVQRTPDPNAPPEVPPGPEPTDRPADANVIVGNRALESGGPGVLVAGSTRNQVIDNVLHGANDSGVELDLADDTVVAGNDLRYNKSGIDLKSSNRNRLENNNTSETVGVGIGLEALSLGNTIVGNTSNLNIGDGIYVGDPAPTGSGNTLERNITSRNAGHGIRISAPSHLVTGNTAEDNGSWGIYGPAGIIDGGGNRGAGNVEPPQCVSVRCDGSTGPPDRVAPEVQIVSGPANPTTADAATFRFVGQDNLGTVRFECRLDSINPADFTACTSPRTYPGLAVGPHTVEVRAVDEAGNASTLATFGWTVGELPADVAPETVLDATPDAVSTAPSGTFRFSSSEPRSTFECDLDGAGFTDCTSPQTYDGLAAGPHTVTVRAVDEEGNTDATPATFTWTVVGAPAPAEVGCGELITRSVLVTNDLLDCPGTGLVVGADNIVVDLGGHVIDGVGVGTGILNPRHDAVVLTNGSVREFEFGVELRPGAARGTVTGLSLDTNGEAGIALADADDAGVGNTLRGNDLVANGTGIVVGPGTRGTVIRDNTLADNTADGIRVDLAGANRIEGNQIRGSGGAAVALVRAADNVVTGNRLASNTGGGIEVGAEALPSNRNRVEANAVTASGGFGIAVVDSAGAQLVDNVISGTTGPGIALAGARDGLVLGNDVGANGAGIDVAESSGNRIEANDATGTTGEGIALGAISLSNQVLANSVGENAGAGITVDDLAPIGQGNLIERNTANANGGDGVFVGAAGHTVRGNTANVNGAWGIYAEAGTTDGGGNRAGGNVEPAQCFGIACAIATVPGTPETVLQLRPADPSPSRYALFTFVGSDDTTPLVDIQYQCRLDSTLEEDFVDCEYPQEYLNVAPGQHTFEVRAVDMDLRVDPTPASYTWTYQAPEPGVAPDTAIALNPGAETPVFEGLFTFTSTEADTAFECQLDNGPWQVCSDEATQQLGYGFYEYAFEETQLGRHRFAVRAVDIEGLADPTPAVHEWTISGGPLTTILTGPADLPPEGPFEPLTGGETESRTATFTFDSSNEPLATFLCSLDFGPFLPCDTPAPTPPAPPGGTVKTVTYTDLPVGSHSLRIVATDPQGREELEAATYEWEILTPAVTAPPETTITSNPAPNSSDTRFTFTGLDDVTPPSLLEFECRLDSTNELDFAGCENPYNLLETYTYADPQMAPGTHTFDVRAIDDTGPDGQPDPTPASYTWTSVPDTIGPDTAIVARPAARTGSTLAAFEFLGADNATPELQLAFECSLDGGPVEPCATPFDVAVEPGQHTLAVRTVDLAGNLDPTPAVYSWTVVGAPVTRVLTGPDPLSDQPAATFTFAADQAGSTFECALNGAPFRACVSPVTFGNLLSGDQVFQVRATNPERVVEEPPVTVEWNVELPPDTLAPDTTIDSGPGATSSNPTEIFTFSANEAATFECALDGGSFGSCSSPAEVQGLLDGPHTYAVRAVDTAGNVDPTPAVREWTVDLAPESDIVSGPEPLTTATSATFVFEASEPGATFECYLGFSDGVTASGGPLGPCTSPRSFENLAVGQYLFAVRARDAQGNLNAVWEVWEWTVGLGARVESGPADPTENTAATFTFAANDPTATLQCSLDGAAFTPCTSPKQYPSLGVGPHEFQVQAVKPGIDIDPIPVAYQWTIIDETAPDTFVEAGPANPSENPEATFVFAASEPGVSYECALDGAPFGPCPEPSVFGDLPLGGHLLEVRAVDASQNVDPTPVSYPWTVVPDGTAPETTIVSGPPLTNADIDALFEFTAVDEGSPLDVTFECALDGAVFEPCDSPHEVQDLVPGDHTLAVRGTDPAGNVEQSPAVYTWNVVGEFNTLPGANVTVEVETPDGLTSAAVTFTTVTSGGATTITPLTTAPPLPAGAYLAGAQVFDVRTTAAFTPPLTVCIEFDPAAYPDPGSVRLLHAENGVWVDVTGPSDLLGGEVCGVVSSLSPFAVAASSEPQVDRAPEATITSGPPARTVNYDVAFGFTGVDDLTPALDLEFECSVDGVVLGSCSSPFEFEALTAGPHTFSVRALDAAGNLGPPATRTWTVIDMTAPDTSIDAGPQDVTTDSNATFEFSGVFDPPADAVGATFECALNEGDFAPCTSPHTVRDLTEGPQVLLVRTRDAAGNVDPSPDFYEWLVEGPPLGVAPDTFVLAGPPSQVATDTLVRLAFTANQAGVEFECSLNGAPLASCESPVEYDGMAEGFYEFRVRAVNEFGNADLTPAVYSWSVGAPPQTVIAGGPGNPSEGTTATFAFSADQPGSTFACTLDGGDPVPCVSPFLVRDLLEGPHRFEVAATNRNRAVDLTPAVFDWTVGLPPDTTDLVVRSLVDPVEQTSTLELTFSGVDDRTPGLEIEFECRVDAAPFEGCESPVTYDYAAFPPGDHVIEVRAKDLGGSVDPTPARHAFTIAPSPETSVLSGPAPQTESTEASFTFASNQPGTTFQCSLDRAPAVFTPCASPQSYAGLAPGAHQLLVRAQGPSGVVDPTPAAFGWEIGDLTPPIVTITTTPPAETADPNARFVFAADDPTATFVCSLDGAAPVTCTSPVELRDLQPGEHSFTVEPVKPNLLVEPVGAEYQWTVLDVAPPETVIGSGPAASTPDQTAAFVFSGTDNGTLPADLAFECALDGAPFAACSSPVELTELAEGDHTLLVRAIDEATPVPNVDPTPATYRWRIAIPPDTTVTAQPEPTTFATTARFAFTSTEAGSTFSCSLDGAAPAPCPAEVTVDGLAVGLHEFRVTAVDALGNSDPTPVVVTWTVEPPPDTTPPNAAIMSAPPATAMSPTAVFTLAANEPGVRFDCALDSPAFVSCASPVQYAGLAAGPHQLRVRATDPAGNVDPTPAVHSWTVSATPPPAPACTASTVNLTASADAWVLQSSAGQNYGPDGVLKVDSKRSGNARALVRFDLPPVPAGCVVTDASLGLYAASAKDGRSLQALRLTGPWTEGGVTWRNQPGTAQPAAAVPSGAGVGYRQWPVAAQVRDMYAANHGFLVRDATESGNGFDQAFTSRENSGNRPTLTVRFGPAPDTAAPDSGFTVVPASSPSSAAEFGLAASEPGSTFRCSLDGAPATPCTTPARLTGLPIGPHTFRVQAVDRVGNVDPTPAEHTWTVQAADAPTEPPPPADTTAPDTRIDSGPTGTSASTSARLIFSADEPGAAFECSLDGAAFAPCTSPVDYTALRAGSHTFAVRALDGVGNRDASPATTTWQVQPRCTGGSVTVAPTADSWVTAKDPGKNFGTDSVLQVSSKPGEASRSLVGFNLPSVPAWCRVTSARLVMYNGSPNAGRTVQVYGANRAWSESGVTWNNQPGVTGPPVEAGTPSAAGRMEWNVTALTQGMYSGSNNGFLIRDKVESNGSEQAFHGREKAPDNPPQLVITFG